MSYVECIVRAIPPRLGAIALAITAAMIIAGCGAGTSATDTPTAASAPPAVASVAASADPGSGAGTGDCGEATAALVKAQVTAPEIISVTTEGGCHDATIVTSLAASETAKALEICDAAAVIAYAGDLSSVTVSGAGDKEMAIGIKGQPCIGEP